MAISTSRQARIDVINDQPGAISTVVSKGPAGAHFRCGFTFGATVTDAYKILFKALDNQGAGYLFLTSEAVEDVTNAAIEEGTVIGLAIPLIYEAGAVEVAEETLKGFAEVLLPQDFTFDSVVMVDAVEDSSNRLLSMLIYRKDVADPTIGVFVSVADPG